MKKKGGRPTKYSKKILQKTQEYINSCEDQERQIVKQSNAEKGYEMYDTKLVVKLPTIEGLAVHLRINRDTIYTWCQDHKEFSDIIEELKAKQADRLLNNGLSGDYNPTIAKVLLTKHGYIERKELTGKDGKDLMPKPLLGGLSNGISSNEGDK